ncbi:unnamed protein product, partial [Closterium sp. NIES-53]
TAAAAAAPPLAAATAAAGFGAGVRTVSAAVRCRPPSLHLSRYDRCPPQPALWPKPPTGSCSGGRFAGFHSGLRSFAIFLPRPHDTYPAFYAGLWLIPPQDRNLVGVRLLVSQHVGVWIEPSGETAVCVDGDTYAPLATFTAEQGSGLYTLHTGPRGQQQQQQQQQQLLPPTPVTVPRQVPASHQVAASPQVAVSGQVPVSGPVVVSCSCQSHAHPIVLWHHWMGHPSISCKRAMSTQRLVLGLPRVLSSLPPSLAPPCGPYVEGQLRATPHSSLRPATEPFETLHLEVWGPASHPGLERESFFLVVVDEYSRYTIVFPLAKKSDVTSTLIRWSLTTADTRGRRVSFLHSDRGEVSPTSLWIGSPGAASRFRVWGCLALVRDTSVDKISPRTIPCMFLGFPEDSFDYTFYRPPLHWFFDSRDVCFDESVPYYVSWSREHTCVDLGSGGAGVGAEPVTAGDSSLWGAGFSGAVRGGATTGGATSVGLGEPVTDPRWSERTESWCGSSWSYSGWSSSSNSSSRSSTRNSRSCSTHRSRRSSGRSRSRSSSRSHLLLMSLVFRPLVSPLPLLPPPPLLPSLVLRFLLLTPPELFSLLLCPRCPLLLLTLVLVPRPLFPSLTFVLPCFVLVRLVCLHLYFLLLLSRLSPLPSLLLSQTTTALTEFASTRCLDYATRLVAPPPTSPLAVGGESALGCDALEDRQFELEFLATASPHLCAMLLALEGDPDALDIPTPRTYAEAVSRPWASQWRAAMDSEMASYRSTGTYVDEVPPPWGERSRWHVDLQGEAATGISSGLQGALCG